MPGGRVKPIILVKPTDAQKKKLSDDARKAQLEEARQKTIAAQRALREEQERIAADQRIREKKMKDDEALRIAHESKLAEGSAPSDMKSQQDADEELKRWQLAGLAAEKQHEQDTIVKNVSTTADTVVAPLEPAALLTKKQESTHQSPASNIVDIDSELDMIRSRINHILNDDLPV